MTPSRHFAVRSSHGYPIVDATADIYVTITPTDIQKAVPRDPCLCAVACALKRVAPGAGAEALIYKTVAYVSLPCDKETVAANPTVAVKVGQTALHRFLVDETLKLQITLLDYSGSPDPGGHRLRAPTAARRLAAGKARRKKYPNRWRGKKVITRALPWQRPMTSRLAK